MMTADECRAKADDLTRAADAEPSYALVLEMEAMARRWRGLACLADWQEAVQSALG